MSVSVKALCLFFGLEKEAEAAYGKGIIGWHSVE